MMNAGSLQKTIKISVSYIKKCTKIKQSKYFQKFSEKLAVNGKILLLNSRIQLIQRMKVRLFSMISLEFVLILEQALNQGVIKNIFLRPSLEKKMIKQI